MITTFLAHVFMINSSCVIVGKTDPTVGFFFYFVTKVNFVIAIKAL